MTTGQKDHLFSPRGSPSFRNRSASQRDWRGVEVVARSTHGEPLGLGKMSKFLFLRTKEDSV